MLPHKTERGKEALRRLKTYDGCPPPYDRRKKVVVPGAMRLLCLQPGRKVRIIFHTWWLKLALETLNLCNGTLKTFVYMSLVPQRCFKVYFMWKIN